jgi:signal transduction histidine kinase
LSITYSTRVRAAIFWIAGLVLIATPLLGRKYAWIGYLQKGHWRSNAFEYWLVLSLIIGLVSQAVFMSHSGALFDYEFNITERKEADRIKSEYVSTVSHELRMPLTSIKSSIGLVTSGNLGELPGQSARMIEAMVVKPGGDAG